MKRVRAVISGRVQGVCYRAYARDRAIELGVRGYVKNLPDGNVELVAVGDEDRVEALLHWAAQGPPGARVDRVLVKDLDAGESFDRFVVTY